MENYPFIPYKMKSLPEQVMIARGQDFYRQMSSRRSVRHFSSKPVPRECIELAIRTAATAPSGANRQPWRFVAVSDDGIKQQDPRGGRDGRAHILRGGPNAVGMVAGAGSAGHRLAQAVPGDRPVDRGGVRGNLPGWSRGPASEELLCQGECGHRLRTVHRRPPRDGPGNSHAHPQPHGLPLKDPWPTRERAAVHPVPSGLPRG